MLADIAAWGLYAPRVPTADDQKVSDRDLALLGDRPWGSLTPGQGLADLVMLGWVPYGVGDWAVGLRSPLGLLAARLCLFDPAHSALLDLCRRRPANP